MDFIYFDYSKLKEFLATMKRRVEEHDTSFFDVKQLQQVQSDTTAAQGKEIRHLNELSVSFKQGLDDLHAMSDKVNAWNERFRQIEERNYQIYKDLNDVSLSLQTQINDLQNSFEASSAELLVKLQSEIVRKHGEGEKNTQNRCKVLEEELEKLKLEHKISLERLQRDMSERVNGFYEFMGVSTPSSSTNVPSFSSLPDNLELRAPTPTTSSASVKGNPMKTLALKIANIERKMFIPAHNEFESINLSEPKGKEDAVLELNHRFSFLSREIEGLKGLISIVQGAPETTQTTTTKKENYISLLDKINDLNKLREAMPALMSLEQRVSNLTETMNSFSEKQRAPDFIFTSPILTPSRHNRSSVTLISPPPETARGGELPNMSTVSNKSEDKRLVIEVNESSESEKDAQMMANFEVYERKMDEVCETLGKVLRTIPQKVNIAEFEELSVQVKKLNKDRQRELNKTHNDDSSAKLDEFENRLNKLWKQNLDLGNLAQQLSEQLIRSSQDILEQQESKIGSVSAQVTTSQNEIRKQLEVVTKNFQQMATEFEAKDKSTTEQWLKSQVLALKRSLQETDEKVEQMEELIVGQNQLMTDDANELEEIPNLENMTGIQKMQALLSQHDKAIRMLANRVNMGHLMEEQKSKKSEATDVLMHLEDLRIEMHELQVKYDTNKTLSTKELEKVGEIYNLLSTKSDRKELGKKVDKSELKRLERLLRKQIEKVNEALKKAEEAPQHPREDPFFLKKRLDVDCAACGQVLPNFHEHAQHYAPKERFPTRTGLFGPGFSRLLASLVPNENGGVSLPRGTQGVSTTDVRSPNTSPPPISIPRALPSSSSKRRLPKLTPKG
mmetsp:Transcript_28527/g.50664  ORF Transcript_28527/g.50664 Transcript_28527/m.50664 type:complete len:844 (+) Transcript_28527:137-2668(+)